MRTLALIPARAGSKGIPHKNTRAFRGKALISYAIDVGIATCNKTVVTTDDTDVATIAASHGVPVVIRPPELAADETPMLSVIQHALQMLRDDSEVIVLLQPTSPLRTRGHVRAALRALGETGADSVVSVVQIPAHLAPEWAVQYDGKHIWPVIYGFDTLDEVPRRRQDTEPAYYRDGSVYAIRRATLDAGRLYGDLCVPIIIPASESATLDTEEDWAVAEARHG